MDDFHKTQVPPVYFLIEQHVYCGKRARQTFSCLSAFVRILFLPLLLGNNSDVIMNATFSKFPLFWKKTENDWKFTVPILAYNGCVRRAIWEARSAF